MWPRAQLACPSLRVRDAIMGAHDMYVSVGYGLLSYIRVDAPSHLRAPVMHAVAILHDVVGGAERAPSAKSGRFRTTVR